VEEEVFAVPANQPAGALPATEFKRDRRGYLVLGCEADPPSEGDAEIELPENLVGKLAWCPQPESNPRYGC
jgi:hypothetical protein